MNDPAVLGAADPPPLQHTVEVTGPTPVYNCPDCSQWLPPGTLACPACHAFLYAGHLREIAQRASAAENTGDLATAVILWRSSLHWLPPETTQYQTIARHAEELGERIRTAEQLTAARRDQWTRRLGPLAKPVFAMARALPLLYALFKLKFLFSFLGFFAIYWALFGPWFGAGFTVSILLHEMGHYVAAKRRGLKVDLPVFLPGMGAYVRWYAAGVTLDDLSGIALAGPFAGLLTSIAFGVASTMLAPGKPHDLCSALAHVSAWLNLLNLIPVFGLDGAQATYALDRTQRGLVFATALIFFGWLHEWTFLGIAVGMGWRLFRGGYAPQPSTRTLVRYVLLLFTLGLIILRFPDTTQRF